MTDQTFPAIVSDALAEGQHQLADVMREILYRTRPDLFALLDFDDDGVFLEPLLFAYFNAPQPSIPLDQLLYGYLGESRPDRVTVMADAHGVLYLPEIGYFLDCPRGQGVSLSWDRDSNVFELRRNGTPLAVRYQEPARAAGTSVEVYRHQHPLLLSAYADESSQASDVDIEDPVQEHLPHVARALGIIERLRPTFLRDILTATRKIAIFHDDRLNSFATLSVHGAAFLNAGETDDEVFFVEDLIHQCGHVIFSAVAFDQQSFFRIHPDTPLKELTHSAGERRSVYVTLHGVFTESRMAEVLAACLEDPAFSARQRHEILGRLTYLMRRFRIDLRNLSAPGIFSDRGRVFYGEFERVLGMVEAQWRERIDSVDVSNQPYNFSYAKFAAVNPIGDD